MDHIYNIKWTLCRTFNQIKLSQAYKDMELTLTSAFSHPSSVTSTQAPFTNYS